MAILWIIIFIFSTSFVTTPPNNAGDYWEYMAFELSFIPNYFNGNK